MGGLTSPAGTRVQVGDNDALAATLVAQGWKRDEPAKAAVKKVALTQPEPAATPESTSPVA